MKRKKSPLHSKPNLVDRRLQIFLLVAIGAFCILVFRLWTIQIYQNEKYVKLSERNFYREVPVLSERGRILDRNGWVLASDENFWDVWIPIAKRSGGKNVVTPNVKRSLELLSDILDESYAVLESKYTNGKRNYHYKQNRVRVASRISWQYYVSIRERTIEFPSKAMVFTQPVPTRRYWFEESASHILGYTGEINKRELESRERQGYKSGDRIGRTGIERQYELLLRGIDGVNKVIVDKYEIQQGQAKPKELAKPGSDVVLNLDKDLQQAAEMILGVSEGIIIASDPRNGAILAMANYPRFNPHRPGDYMNDKDQPLFHKAVAGSFEPGSVFKVFETLALLEADGYYLNPNDTVYCPGVFTYPGGASRCHKREGHGHLNMYGAVAKSCNVYFYTKITQLGFERLYPWMAEFGLNRLTNIDLPNERIEPFPTPKYFGDMVNISIGQGDLLLTPIQVATALNAIANRGTVYQPQLAQKILAPDERVMQVFEPKVAHQIDASTETWDIIHQSMWDVVNAGGTGRRIIKDDDNFEIAAKTGTAQTSIGDLTHAWFVCFAPYDNPEITITVITELAGHGGEQAAPLARQLLDVYFGRLNVEDLMSEPLVRL
ncbi:MAG: penicillin-binding protein 2 [Candidatus Hinthialibacter antarcticus]|nr:penicillin-binding protein 2 [Candidatus Hinthialibacter antarcticus]